MKINEIQKGILYIIPSPLGYTPPLEVLPISIKTVINELTHFIVENEKMGRRFIKKIVPSKNQDELVVFQLINTVLRRKLILILIVAQREFLLDYSQM